MLEPISTKGMRLIIELADIRATPLGKRVQANLGAKNHAVIMPDGQSSLQI